MTTKKAASRKKVASKKTATAKASMKKPGTLTPESHIKVVANSGVPKMPNRRKVKDAVPPKGITASALMEKTGCRIDTIKAMIGKGFLEAR